MANGHEFETEVIGKLRKLDCAVSVCANWDRLQKVDFAVTRVGKKWTRRSFDVQITRLYDSPNKLAAFLEFSPSRCTSLRFYFEVKPEVDADAAARAAKKAFQEVLRDKDLFRRKSLWIQVQNDGSYRIDLATFRLHELRQMINPITTASKRILGTIVGMTGMSRVDIMTNDGRIYRADIRDIDNSTLRNQLHSRQQRGLENLKQKVSFLPPSISGFDRPMAIEPDHAAVSAK